MNCNYCKKEMGNARSEKKKGIIGFKEREFIGYACVNPKCNFNGRIILFSGNLLTPFPQEDKK